MKKILLSFLMAGSLFAENFVNLQISNETLMVEGQYKISFQEPFYIRGGYLINSKDSNFVYVGIKSEGQIIGANLPATFSLFLDYVNTKNNSAIPVGIGVNSYLKGFSIPLFIRGEVEYAPKILSFEEANKFVKLKIETGATFIENGEVFVGYRDISFDKNYNSVFYAGVGFNF